MLDAGIDVFSTVNVQHLESLNDRVAELTGVRVRETFPDQVLGSADEVVLVDLTPEALIARLRAGKVYPAERVPAALNNFFRVENLAALREVVLRQTAEEVESKRAVPAGELLGTREELLADEAPQAVAERVLALVTPRAALAAAGAPRLALGPAARRRARPALRDRARGRRRAARSASSSRRCAGWRRCSGAHLLVEEGDDLVDAAARVAAERGTTYVLIGQPQPHTGLRRFTESLPDRLLRKLPGVDVRIVADRSRRLEPSA